MGTLVNLIHHINDAMGLTSIIVSHDVAETAEIADNIYLLSGGKVIEQGSPVQLKRSKSQWVQQFMQGLPDGPVPFHYPGTNLADDFLNPGVSA